MCLPVKVLFLSVIVELSEYNSKICGTCWGLAFSLTNLPTSTFFDNGSLSEITTVIEHSKMPFLSSVTVHSVQVVKTPRPFVLSNSSFVELLSYKTGSTINASNLVLL